MNPIILIASKESGELLGSGRGLGWLLALSVILSVLALLLVSNTELSLLDNAQVVYMVMGTITALGGLLALVLGSDAIAGEKERGTLIPLLLTPLTTTQMVLGKMGGQVAAWVLMYALSLPYLWAVGSSGQNLVQAIAYLALFGTPVALGFGFYAIGLSARFGNVRTALLAALITLMLLASPLLIGPSLRQSTLGKLFDMVNPFSAALNTFDSVVIDSQPFSMQLGRLSVTLIWLALAWWFARRSARTMEI
ncbi:heme exporter protein B [Sulfuriferula plumbiphila]|uniref:Heme exporter protein B n=1 Tax=Sulfuriferula plumbiphila TaxID=171865 RepID=A0A512L9H5_9PROT|nr:ABC transporter permease subunit [Sulfuriferula plumbiphila]BBP05983.1 heme exporter protein B [Sulfuriferula plumbiphila]GEP31136.1 heme exporter protein B [Sulfuriferula plumbiphila]